MRDFRSAITGNGGIADDELVLQRWVEIYCATFPMLNLIQQTTLSVVIVIEGRYGNGWSAMRQLSANDENELSSYDLNTIDIRVI